ncbi:hypothetical protein Nepgr_023449 [Nepenthes gracilis]|uniref:Uncharacterized protein n=1 Tax=Nepenthes gracilis TaxID=150966 RepID=A0AAD3T2J8_NEPGR|nr:hypothetical protein Nepgr_023449 [Nepenthes gracilis]
MLQEIRQREMELLPEDVAIPPPLVVQDPAGPVEGTDMLLKPLGMEEEAAPSRALKRVYIWSCFLKSHHAVCSGMISSSASSSC